MEGTDQSAFDTLNLLLCGSVSSEGWQNGDIFAGQSQLSSPNFGSHTLTILHHGSDGPETELSEVMFFRLASRGFGKG